MAKQKPFIESEPIDTNDLLGAMRDNFSPETVATIAMYLHSPDTNCPEINRQIIWFRDRLVELLGGSKMYNTIC